MNIAINLDQASRLSGELEQRQHRLLKYGSRVQEIAGRCVLSKESRRNLNRVAAEITREISSESRGMGQLCNSLNMAVQAYRRCEKGAVTGSCTSVRWSDAYFGSSSGGAFSSDSTVPVSNNQLSAKWEFLTKLWGEAGIVGKAVSIFLRAADGEWTVKDTLKTGKDLVSIVGKGATAIRDGGTSEKWLNALLRTGFEKADDASKNLNNLTKAQKVADGFSVAAKWAGAAFSVGLNVYDNYNEYKEGGMSVERAVGETIIESAWDIGVGVATTAVVTTIASTLGVPALAIGVGAAAVTWGANTFCKWATKTFWKKERDIGEVLSDFAMDVVEKRVEYSKKVVNKVTSAFSTAWNGICSAFA